MRHGGLVRVVTPSGIRWVEPVPAPWGSRLHAWVAAARFAPRLEGGSIAPGKLVDDGPSPTLELGSEGVPSDDPVRDVALALDALAAEPSAWFGTAALHGAFLPTASTWGDAVLGRAARCGEGVRRAGWVAGSLVDATLDRLQAERAALDAVRSFTLVHGNLVPDTVRRQARDFVLTGAGRACLGDPVLDLAPLWLGPGEVLERILARVGPETRVREAEHRDAPRGRAARWVSLLTHLHELGEELSAGDGGAIDAFVRAEAQLRSTLGWPTDAAVVSLRRASVALLADTDGPTEALESMVVASGGGAVNAPTSRPPTNAAPLGAEAFAQLRADVAAVTEGRPTTVSRVWLDVATAVGVQLGDHLPAAWWHAVADRARTWAWREATGIRSRPLPADLLRLLSRAGSQPGAPAPLA